MVELLTTLSSKVDIREARTNVSVWLLFASKCCVIRGVSSVENG